VPTLRGALCGGEGVITLIAWAALMVVAYAIGTKIGGWR
jgi:hypothetical protein